MVARGGARASRVRRPRHAPVARGHQRRRGDPRRRLHGPVDRVVPEGAPARPRRGPARGGHLRRRPERSQRRVLRRVVGEDPRCPRDVRRRRRDGAADDLRPGADRDRHVVSGERRRRVVPTRWRPRGRDEREARGGVGRRARGRASAGRRGRVPAALGRRGAAAMRLAPVRQRGADRRRGDRAPGAPGERPAAAAARERCPDLRAHHGDPARDGQTGGRRDAQRHRPGGRRGDRPGRVGDVVEGVQAEAHAPRLVHGDHRTGARPPRGARLDRRRSDQGPAVVDPLPADHAGRPDRVRAREGCSRTSRVGSTTGTTTSPDTRDASRTTCTGCSRASRACRSRPRGAARST